MSVIQFGRNLGYGVRVANYQHFSRTFQKTTAIFMKGKSLSYKKVNQFKLQAIIYVFKRGIPRPIRRGANMSYLGRVQRNIFVLTCYTECIHTCNTRIINHISIQLYWHYYYSYTSPWFSFFINTLKKNVGMGSGLPLLCKYSLLCRGEHFL